MLGAAHRIDHIGNTRLVLDDELRVARAENRSAARSRLDVVCSDRTAQHRRHRLDCRADDVVVGVLLVSDTRPMSGNGCSIDDFASFGLNPT